MILSSSSVFYFWVLALVESLSPQARDRFAIAEAIATVSQDTPLFDGDDGPGKTAALLVSVASYESTFNVRAYNPSDKTKSYGLFQTPRHLTPKDPLGQAMVARGMLAESLAKCGDLTGYVSGACGRGFRSAHERQSLALRLCGAD